MDAPTTQTQVKATSSFSEAVKSTLRRVFEQSGGKLDNLYKLMLEEFDRPYFEFLMDELKNNQSAVTRVSGLARGTVRKKLKEYDLLDA